MTKLCARGKAAAKRKFKVYPSAYANAYASKICAGKIKDPSGVKRKDFKGPKPAKLGGEMKRTVKKAGIGTIMLMNEIKKQGKKEGRRQAAEGQSQDKQYQDYLTSKKASKGAMMKKPIKAGKGMLMPMFGLAGMMKYMDMNKKKSATATPTTDKQSSDYASLQQTGGDNKTKKMNTGDIVQLTDTFEGHEVKGGSIQGDYGTNSSMQNYYKDLLG